MICIHNETTQEQAFETVATERGFFETLFKSYQPDLVVIEACRPSGWASEIVVIVLRPANHCSRAAFLPRLTPPAGRC